MSEIKIKQLSVLAPFNITWTQEGQDKSSIFYLDYLQGVLFHFNGDLVEEKLTDAIMAQVRGDISEPEVPDDINNDIEKAQSELIDQENNANEALETKQEEIDVGHETQLEN